MHRSFLTSLLALPVFVAAIACGSKPSSPPGEDSHPAHAAARADDPKALRAEATYPLPAIEEPSGLSLTADSSGLWIVSDEGGLYRTDFEGRVLSKRHFGERDFEGVWAGPPGLYLAQEDNFTLYHFDTAGQELLQTVPLRNTHGNDPANGLESLCFAPHSGEIWTFTEQKPVVHYRLPTGLNTQSPRPLPGAVREVSACTVHDGHLWLLSDKDQALFMLQLAPLAVKARWRVPLKNPEGVTFLPDGGLLILSDQEGKMVRFAPPRD